MANIKGILYYSDTPTENGIGPQRSMIRKIDVAFDSPGVIVNPGDVSFAGTATPPAFTLSQTDASGVTVLTITLAGYGFLDGYYVLSIAGYPDTPFFRLFGDVNGDSQVDNPNDYVHGMAPAYRSRRGTSNYRSYLDFDGDGYILLSDFAQFDQRLGYKLNPDGTYAHV